MSVDVSSVGVGSPASENILKQVRKAIGDSQHKFALNVIDGLDSANLTPGAIGLEILSLLVSIDQRLANLEKRTGTASPSPTVGRT